MNMEFEELRKIWGQQTSETMYTVDERALFKMVTERKDVAGKRINRVEILMSIVNTLTGVFLLIRALIYPNILGFIIAGVVIGTVPCILYLRRKRKKAENIFDRSIAGELDHALSNTNSMITFHRLMIVGYLIPLSVVCVLALIVVDASLDKWLIVTGALALSIFVIRWEQRKFNTPWKGHLLVLKTKLKEE